MIVTQTLVGNWLNLIQLRTEHRKTENLTKLLISPNITPCMAISPLLVFLLFSLLWIHFPVISSSVLILFS